MFRYLTVFLIFLISSAVFAENITLVKNGKPTATIVLPPKAGLELKKAAAELSAYVKKLSGVGLPIRANGAQVHGTALILGDKKAPLPPVVKPREQYALESFSLRVSNGNVYFGGRSPEAISYGVLAFIEDNLGVRWFGPGTLWEYLPPHKKGELTVEVSSKVVTPDTPHRILSSTTKQWDKWIWQNRAKSRTKKIRGKFSANTIHKVFPADKFAKTHPEYYPLIRGKRNIPPRGKIGHGTYFWPCVSNPEVVKLTADYIKKWFDTHPEEYSFSLGMNDITKHCHCANCIAMDKDLHAIERDDLVDRTCLFINAVARELKKTHPKRYIGMLIYRHLYKIPAKTIKLEDNVFIYMTCEAAAWWGAKGAKLEKKDMDMTRVWARISSLPLSRYEYIGNGTFAPQFFPHLLDQQIKFDHKMGMEGQYTECYTFLPHTVPMIWAFYKLQWNSALNMDKLLQEFYSKMFGAANGSMSEYYALLERAWKTPRLGRKSGFLTFVRNLEQQCLAISPAEIREGLSLLDKALAVAKQDKVKKRIKIIKAALNFAKYGVESYWLNRDLRSTAIKTLNQAQNTLASLSDYAELSIQRNAFLANAENRQDILGESIRGLKSRRYIMADKLAFKRMDNTLIPVTLDLIDWYSKNEPAKLQKVRQVLNSMTLPKELIIAVKIYGEVAGTANLLGNSGFEEIGSTSKHMKGNDDWDTTGAPKGWRVWVRPRGKYQLPLSKTSVRKKAGRNGSKAAVFSAGPGGYFISSVAVKPGEKYFCSVWMRANSPEAATKGNIVLKFIDTHGKLMSMDARKRKLYEQIYGVSTKDWQRLALCTTVPQGAVKICIMVGLEHLDKGEVIFDDVLLLQASGGLKSSNLEELFADGKFKTQAKGHLSAQNVRKAKGRDGDTALAFTAGNRGDNSYIKISGIGCKYDFKKAMTFEAWIQVDQAYRKGTLEIAGNPVTDRGKGFRLYLNRGIIYFYSGSGKPYKTAKTWGTRSNVDRLIKPDKWYHIAATYDGSIFRIFIDGKLAGSSSPGLQLTKGKPDICIGSYHDGLVYGFMGKMGNVNIYDRALSVDEIKQHATVLLDDI